MVPREAIADATVGAHAEHGPGGERRQAIVHQARRGRALAGVFRFDRHDDRPEHLGARLQRVQIAHRLGLRRQQVRHVAVQGQPRRDRRRHDADQQRPPEDRRPPPRGPARPADAEFVLGRGALHVAPLCSPHATAKRSGRPCTAAIAVSNYERPARRSWRPSVQNRPTTDNPPPSREGVKATLAWLRGDAVTRSWPSSASSTIMAATPPASRPSAAYPTQQLS
jgi:hypothetical protein